VRANGITWRLAFLLALLLPELPLAPFLGDLPCSLQHPLGTDLLGRDGLLRLLCAGSRSLGLASAVALLALSMALLLALGEDRLRGVRSALRIFPPMLLLLPFAATFSGLGWTALALFLAGLIALHLEPPLRARLDPVRLAPVWNLPTLLGSGPWHRIRIWAPWALDQAAPLFSGAWIAALWGEATLRLLGLGPPPTRDSFGLLLNEELPRLSTDAAPLGWAALLLVLVLAASTSATRNPRGEKRDLNVFSERAPR